MLAAIIIDAVVFGMIDVPELRRLHRVKRFDFWIAVAAVVAVLSAGVLAGVVIGVALSLVWLVYVATSPAHAAARPRAGHAGVPRRRPRTPATRRSPALRSCALDGGLFFATADALEERIRGLVLNGVAPVRAVVLDLEGVDFIDSQGAAKLGEILEFAESSEVELRLARIKPSVAAVLEKDGVLGVLGRDHLHGNVHRAVEAQLRADRGESP